MRVGDMDRWALGNVAVNALFLGCVHQSSHLVSRVHYFSEGILLLGAAACVSNILHVYHSISEDTNEWLGERSRRIVVDVSLLGLLILLPLSAIVINKRFLPSSSLMKIDRGSVKWETSYFQHFMQALTLCNALVNGITIFTAHDRFSKITGGVLSLSYLSTIKTVAGWKMIRAVFERDVPQTCSDKFCFSYCFSVMNADHPVVIQDGKAVSYATVVKEFVEKMRSFPLTSEVYEIGDRWETRLRQIRIGNQRVIIPEEVCVRFCHFCIPKKFALNKLSSFSELSICLTEGLRTTHATLTYN